MKNNEFGKYLQEKFGGEIDSEKGSVIWIYDGCCYLVRVSKNGIRPREREGFSLDGIVFLLTDYENALGIATFEKKSLGKSDLCSWSELLNRHEEIKARKK